MVDNEPKEQIDANENAIKSIYIGSTFLSLCEKQDATSKKYKRRVRKFEESCLKAFYLSC